MIMLLPACETATDPTIDFSDDALVTVKYKAYYSAPYLTPAASDMAARHCAKYGKKSYYKGATVPSQLSATELHEFRCE